MDESFHCELDAEPETISSNPWKNLVYAVILRAMMDAFCGKGLPNPKRKRACSFDVENCGECREIAWQWLIGLECYMASGYIDIDWKEMLRHWIELKAGGWNCTLTARHLRWNKEGETEMPSMDEAELRSRWEKSVSTARRENKDKICISRAELEWLEHQQVSLQAVHRLFTELKTAGYLDTPWGRDALEQAFEATIWK